MKVAALGGILPQQIHLKSMIVRSVKIAIRRRNPTRRCSLLIPDQPGESHFGYHELQQVYLWATCSCNWLQKKTIKSFLAHWILDIWTFQSSLGFSCENKWRNVFRIVYQSSYCHKYASCSVCLRLTASLAFEDFLSRLSSYPNNWSSTKLRFQKYTNWCLEFLGEYRLLEVNVGIT